MSLPKMEEYLRGDKMKPYEEMTLRERKAYRNVKNAAEDYIYSLLNGCFDEEEAYEDYVKELSDLEYLKKVVYTEALSAVYDEGCSFGGEGAKAYIKDIRFCGKPFLEELVDYFCRKFQTEALNDLATAK